MESNDVTELVERLEMFEERAGVRLEAISAFGEQNEDGNNETTLQVCGEAHAVTGPGLTNHIEIEMTVYDDRRRVIGKRSELLYPESFYGFEIFEFRIDVPTRSISKIRIVPRVRQ